MKKYKLINTKTNEEHLCDKVTIDGFEYYANDNNVDLNDWVTNGLQIAQVNVLTVNDPNKHLHKKVIATTNPNIDIPKVVDEVERLAFKYTKVSQAHRRGFIDGYNKCKEEFGSSDKDMIEFGKWLRQEDTKENAEKYANFTDADMLKLWKKQQPITLYYES